ncbi:PTS mannitol transporter subunit IIA [Escherichia coli]|nr:PTS mannitol transporter subunit IIA [Escherichia coli]AUG15062.1 PTS mannitol transporter subunit IIA [Escherichia coli str. K-12 substr. MG1655]AVI54804.1 PTS mannitol transporter subunit IIA [Escherichia coli str. K-12 substr. MG1655]AVZ47814.1 PTS mannitol transporter subunit IIA [Escherichia coli]AVZ52812.1 PTS mannitol transporter subunit IIA [Escherichia coli]
MILRIMLLKWRRTWRGLLPYFITSAVMEAIYLLPGNDSNLLIVFYVQIMPDDFVMLLHRF